jgi:tetratricopeptide (TPR) repeat protein
MLSGVLLAVLPSAAITMGVLSVFRRKTGRERSGSVLFSAGCALIFIAALLVQYLAVPIYSIGKAKYLLGITPCLAVLGAQGLGCLSGRPGSRRRTVLLAVLICWGAGVYGAYFAGEPTDEMRIADHYKLHVEALKRGRVLEAADQIAAIRRINAVAVTADNELIRALDQNVQAAAGGGDYRAALSILERLRELQPDIPVHDYNAACIYARMGEVETAVFWLDQAIKKGFRDWELMNSDPDLVNIRNTPLMTTLPERTR